MKQRASQTKRKNKTFTMLFGVIILFCVACIGLFFAHRYFLKQVYPLKYYNLVIKESQENHLDPALVYAVIKAESNFNENAKSHAGAMGLMQMTPDTFRWMQSKKSEEEASLSEKDLYIPQISIRYGCRLLGLLLNEFNGDEIAAVCAYNAGIGRVNQWLNDSKVSKDGKILDRIPYKETDRYSRKVMQYKRAYRDLYKNELPLKQ